MNAGQSATMRRNLDHNERRNSSPRAQAAVNHLLANLNNRFFGGRLWAYKVEFQPFVLALNKSRYGHAEPDAGNVIDTTGATDFANRRIIVNARWCRGPEHLREILIHEMAHAAVGWPGHHRPWWREMGRLIKIGAPVDPYETDNFNLTCRCRRFHRRACVVGIFESYQ